MTTNHPQHGPMTAAELRSARDMYDTLREGTYWKAAAINASYMDADAVVRAWRMAKAADEVRAREIPLPLWAALEALAEGWPR